MLAREMGPSAAPIVPALVRLLRNPDSGLRSRAVWTLAAVGPAARAALPSLHDMLEYERGRLREDVPSTIERMERGK